MRTMTSLLRPDRGKIWWLIGLASCLGCGRGEATYPVTGKVTFQDGRPLAGGQVEFHPVGNSLIVARGEVREDGTFTLSTYEPGDGAPPGEHEVAIHPPLFEGDRDLTPNPPNIIDPKFEAYDTSGYKFTVTEDEEKNNFTITVTPPSGRQAPTRTSTVEYGLRTGN